MTDDLESIKPAVPYGNTTRYSLALVDPNPELTGERKRFFPTFWQRNDDTWVYSIPGYAPDAFATNFSGFSSFDEALEHAEKHTFKTPITDRRKYMFAVNPDSFARLEQYLQEHGAYVGKAPEPAAGTKQLYGQILVLSQSDEDGEYESYDNRDGGPYSFRHDADLGIVVVENSRYAFPYHRVHRLDRELVSTVRHQDMTFKHVVHINDQLAHGQDSPNSWFLEVRSKDTLGNVRPLLRISSSGESSYESPESLDQAVLEFSKQSGLFVMDFGSVGCGFAISERGEWKTFGGFVPSDRTEKILERFAETRRVTSREGQEASAQC